MPSSYEKVIYGGWPNCIRLFNAEIELVVTTDIGPRIVSCGFIGGKNLFYLVPDHRGKTGGSEWRIYGGHRLWLAPEAIPQSYSPDNEKVEYTLEDQGLTLTQAGESTTGVAKEMQITLSNNNNEVTVLHRIVNQNLHEVEFAPWALSVLAQGGRAIIPQEPYGEGDNYLLPARPMALWQFTKMNDPRWVWGAKYIQAIHDPSKQSEQKIGVLNKQGWTAYYSNGTVLIKKFDFNPQGVYPDFGCNNETYINGHFIEIETLGPLTKLPPGGIAEHTEHWLLAKVTLTESEESIDLNLLPLVTSFNLPK